MGYHLSYSGEAFLDWSIFLHLSLACYILIIAVKGYFALPSEKEKAEINRKTSFFLIGI